MNEMCEHHHISGREKHEDEKIKILALLASRKY